MKLSFFYTATFERKFKRYKKKYVSLETDLKSFISKIEGENPDNMGGGIYKYRLSVQSKGKGKSGGFRVITLEAVTQITAKDITFLTMYDKSEQENITKQEIQDIIKQEGLK